MKNLDSLITELWNMDSKSVLLLNIMIFIAVDQVFCANIREAFYYKMNKKKQKLFRSDYPFVLRFVGIYPQRAECKAPFHFRLFNCLRILSFVLFFSEIFSLFAFGTNSVIFKILSVVLMLFIVCSFIYAIVLIIFYKKKTNPKETEFSEMKRP